MNAITTTSFDRRAADRRLSDRRTTDRFQPEPATPIRHLHRDRDFGVGYGNSSGYASHGRYTSAWNQPRFRVA